MMRGQRSFANFATTKESDTAKTMKRYLSGMMAIFLVTQLQAQTTFKLTLTSQIAQDDAPVVLQLAPYGDVRKAEVRVDGVETPSQLDDLNGDGVNDELCFVTSMSKNQKRTATVTLYNIGEQKAYPARTFAEIVLRNPSQKAKNKNDIYLNSISIDQATKDPYHVLHHHGVAFESELVALRVYMDKRQTIDLYGKFHKGLEIEATQFYPSKEQKAQGFGDDVLWVGNTFGLGAFRVWDGQQPTMLSDVKSRTQRILAQGPVRTIVEMEDQGWTISPNTTPVNMTERFTLYAGHRDIRVDVSFNRDVSSHAFSTGIINVKNSEEYSNHKGLRGCWGSDYPASDTVNYKRETVGLGIYIPNKSIEKEVPANKDNYAFVVRPSQKLHYWISYTSANEEFGYHSANEWFAYLKKWQTQLENPVKVELER
jgi:hypothetical protein